MGIAALVTALVLHAHALAHRPQVVVRPVWPAQGTITSPFGDDHGRYHPGIDIGILRSLVVRAAIPGRVEKVGEPTGFEGYGNIVLVSLGSDIQALYAHLESVRVHVGDDVFAGELLGHAGCTGYCTGTHLHFELRDDGVPFDAAPLLPN